jgi:hypothetical protein
LNGVELLGIGGFINRFDSRRQLCGQLYSVENLLTDFLGFENSVSGPGCIAPTGYA